MDERATQRVLRDSLRRVLRAPDQVGVLQLRAAALSGRRQSQMALCRSLLQERGYTGLAVFRGSRTEPEAVGERAALLLEQDEERADVRPYWWRYDVVWSSQQDSRLVSVEDYDGRALLFAGWGPGTDALLDELGALLSPAPETSVPAATAPPERGWRRLAVRPRVSS